MTYRRVAAASIVLAHTTMPPVAPSEDAGDDAASAAATPGSIRLLRRRLGRAYQSIATQRPPDPGLAGYLVLIIAGLFLPILAVIGYLAIALYYIIPSRRLSAGFLPKRRRSPRP